MGIFSSTKSARASDDVERAISTTTTAVEVTDMRSAGSTQYEEKTDLGDGPRRPAPAHTSGSFTSRASFESRRSTGSRNTRHSAGPPMYDSTTTVLSGNDGAATGPDQMAVSTSASTTTSLRAFPRLDRAVSPPPGVSPFGGVSPDGPDADRGLHAVRSREEEEKRIAEVQEKGVDPWSVTFEPGEKINPKNWNRTYRWYLTFVGGLLVLNSTFASSIPSGVMTRVLAHYHTSEEVGILTLSLFVAGYCLGPLLWGPLSEVYGRRPIFIITFACYAGLQVGCALAPNIGALLAFRVLSGTFAAAPLTNSGALLADIWDVDTRSKAMATFGLAPFAGPTLAPIVGGAIAVSPASWRWVYWVTTMFAGFCFLVIVFTIPETYGPAILAKKAKKLRADTGDERWYAPIERRNTSFRGRLNDIILKPFIMLALEPVLLACTIYMAFVYGLIYLLFVAFPFVFEINHGFNQLENGLAFLGFFTGGCATTIFYMFFVDVKYQEHARRIAPDPVPPEKRLDLCVFSGWALVIAMFWFGWTSYSSVHWISPVLAGALIGVGVQGMFISLFNFIVDCYLWAAASALAASTVVRASFGAAFPLFASQMYERLGTQWASSLLGFCALLLAPVPLVLRKYGPALRKRSRYTASM